MLLRDLKKTANKCCINPKKPTPSQRVVIDVGNPDYWVTKAIEVLTRSKDHLTTSKMRAVYLQEATELLILTQAYTDEKAAIVKKARNNSAGQDSKDVKK